MTDGSTHYNGIAKIAHWWIAGMIVLQFVLANLAEQAEDAGSPLQQLALLANHKSVGVTILAIAIFRLFWRTFKPPPVPLPMPTWQRSASYVSHWTLYGLLFLMPVTGWLMSSASASSVSWFNLLPLPDFIGPDEGLKATLEEVHETLAKVMFVVAAIHIAAGLKHTFINKDGALRRISSPVSIAIFAIVIVGGFYSLSNVGGDAAPPIAPEPTRGETSISPRPDDSFDANGQIAIKNMSTKAPLAISIAETSDRILLDGTTIPGRPPLQPGSGEWLGTDSVSRFVDVAVDVEAQSKEGQL